MISRILMGSSLSCEGWSSLRPPHRTTVLLDVIHEGGRHGSDAICCAIVNDETNRNFRAHRKVRRDVDVRSADEDGGWIGVARPSGAGCADPALVETRQIRTSGIERAAEQTGPSADIRDHSTCPRKIDEHSHVGREAFGAVAPPQPRRRAFDLEAMGE